jgi:type I restriction enzyme, S subunit
MLLFQQTLTIAANIAETGVLDFDACIPDSVIGLVADRNKANNMFIEYMLQVSNFF